MTRFLLRYLAALAVIVALLAALHAIHPRPAHVPASAYLTATR